MMEALMLHQDGYLSYLRKRFAALQSKVTIQAKRGVGYRLDKEECHD